MKMKKIFILLMILSIFFLMGAECSFAQDAEETVSDDPADSAEITDEPAADESLSERIALDASTLAAGGRFTFTITVNSDENLSFADAQTLLTAVLCR